MMEQWIRKCRMRGNIFNWSEIQTSAKKKSRNNARKRRFSWMAKDAIVCMGRLSCSFLFSLLCLVMFCVNTGPSIPNVQGIGEWFDSRTSGFKKRQIKLLLNFNSMKLPKNRTFLINHRGKRQWIEQNKKTIVIKYRHSLKMENNLSTSFYLVTT